MVVKQTGYGKGPDNTIFQHPKNATLGRHTTSALFIYICPRYYTIRNYCLIRAMTHGLSEGIDSQDQRFLPSSMIVGDAQYFE